MLHQITWTAYFETLGLTTVIYYGLIALKFYATDIHRFIQTQTLKSDGQQTSQIPFFAREAANEEDEEFEAAYPAAAPVQYEEAYEESPDDTMQEADTLIARIKSVIRKTANKPYNPPALVQEIKAIFSDSNTIKDSPHRDAINELVVTECERTGTALLTEDEVDGWWND